MKTIDYIKQLKENFIRLSKEQEKAILKYWGKNISPVFTEQDIEIQTSKVIASTPNESINYHFEEK